MSCAIAKVEPSSLADATFKPLLMADWTVARLALVLLRYCRATSAPVLVLTLSILASVLALIASFLLGGLFAPHPSKAIAVPEFCKVWLTFFVARGDGNRCLKIPYRQNIGPVEFAE